jgi:hypothetical protein
MSISALAVGGSVNVIGIAGPFSDFVSVASAMSSSSHDIDRAHLYLVAGFTRQAIVNGRDA